MKSILFISLFIVTFRVASQPAECDCKFVHAPKTGRQPPAVPTFKYNRTYAQNILHQRIAEDTISAIRQTIDAVDALLKKHFDDEIKEQLRGVRDSYEDRKYLNANRHAQFLCALDSLSLVLEMEKKHFHSIQFVSSIKPIFQAYLNSLNIYHDQSRNLVNWHTVIQRLSANHKKVHYAGIYEGRINIYNQSYNFVELCKNNLLKEFSILELALVADSLRNQLVGVQNQLDTLQQHFNSKNKVLQDSLNNLSAKLTRTHTDTLVQTIRNARYSKKHRRIVIRL
ncbi:hypothetical protein [Spirosoma sp.]|uniref:hypothetical protein n=1 Tax=Spirosoma sp. TaxID=1899569 RepID=UPI003B3A93FA